MPTEFEEEIVPQLTPDLDPTGTAMNGPEPLDPYIAERDKVLALLTAFRAKRPGLLARVSNAGGFAVPQGVIGRKHRTARILLRSLLGGVNTLGRMKAQERTTNYNDMVAQLKERQGVLDDAEGRNKELVRLQKDINAELRAQHREGMQEESLALRKAQQGLNSDPEYLRLMRAAKLRSEGALANQRDASAASHRSRMGWNPNSYKGRGGKGGSGAGGSKDISSPVSQYYEAIGNRMKAGGANPLQVDAWVAKQQETARMNEVARRQGTVNEEANIPPAPAAPRTPIDAPKLTGKDAIKAKMRADMERARRGR
jgi:hypothetical protein